MATSRIDLGLPLAVIESLARVGSIASITLLILLFRKMLFIHLRFHPTSGLRFFSFQPA
jgi:hypothetical protein